MSDPVNNPAHYGGADNPYEVIKVLAAWGLLDSFAIGNCVKYVARAEKKGAPLEDLKKARWYLDHEIKRREKAALEASPALRASAELRAAEKSIGRVESFDDALAQREEAAKHNAEGQARAEAEKNEKLSRAPLLLPHVCRSNLATFEALPAGAAVNCATCGAGMGLKAGTGCLQCADPMLKGIHTCKALRPKEYLTEIKRSDESKKLKEGVS